MRPHVEYALAIYISVSRGEGEFSPSGALGHRWSMFEVGDVTTGLSSLPGSLFL